MLRLKSVQNTSISTRGRNGSVEWEVGQDMLEHSSESDLLGTVLKKCFREGEGRCELSISSSVSDREG